MSRWRELPAVLLASVVLTAAITYPWLFRIGTTARIDSYDGQFSIWNVAWVARTLVTDPRHVLDANIFYPHQGTLTYSETNLGAGLVAIPAYWATGSAYVAHDSAVLFGFVLCFVTVYFLARQLVDNRWACAVSAVVFTFCPFVIARTTQIQLLLTFGIPLAMLAFHRMVDRPTSGRACVLGLAMACETYFCAYYGVFAVLMIGFSVLVVTVTRARWRMRSHWTAVVNAFATALLLVVPLYLPYLARQREFGFARTLDEAALYASDWRAYFASAALAHRWMLGLIGHWTDVDFPGFVAVAGGVSGAWIGWRAGGRLREAVALYGGITALCAWASFGPHAGLYSLLYATVPGFTMMRAPSRFGILVVFGLAVLTAIAVQALLARVRRPALVGAALLVVSSAELVNPLVFPRIPEPSPAYRVLAAQPPGVTIEVPYPEAEDAIRNARYMLSSTIHWMPLVNGFSDWLPPDTVAAAPTLAQFPSPAALAILKTKGTRYAVIHLGAYDLAWRVDMEAKLDTLAPYVKTLYADRETRLYEFVSWPP